MNILLLDEDYIINEQLNSLLRLEKNWELFKSTNINYNEIDLIIVDIFNEKYNKILEDILRVNPSVRTITVSDKLTSHFSSGCDYCASNYKRIRLIKPVNLKLLFDSIYNFDNIDFCPLKDAFDNIEKLLPIILKQFKNLIYDANLQTIFSTSDPESKEHTIQILSLLTLLDKNEIKYTLLSENSIKVHI